MRPPEKTEQSNQIQSDTDAFLKAGNRITRIPIGVSSYEPLKVIRSLARSRGAFKGKGK